jgi:hypothetical protein
MRRDTKKALGTVRMASLGESARAVELWLDWPGRGQAFTSSSFFSHPDFSDWASKRVEKCGEAPRLGVPLEEAPALRNARKILLGPILEGGDRTQNKKKKKEFQLETSPSC